MAGIATNTETFMLLGIAPEFIMQLWHQLHRVAVLLQQALEVRNT